MFEEDFTGMLLPMNTGSVGGPALGSDMIQSNPIAANGLAQSIVKTAEELGINPVDLATVISYETAGTFDPWKAGPTTQWGQHRGLIQWGEPQAKKYGVTQGMAVEDQLRAVSQYLRDAGVEPGMGIADVYSAINAGRVGRYNASDAGNGGAPGTVLDKVNNQMAGHRVKAVNLLNGTLDPQALTRYANSRDNPVADPSMVAKARPSIAQAAADGGPLMFPDQVPGGVPASGPVAAMSSPSQTAAQELQALLDADEQFSALPTPAEIAGIPVQSNIPTPLASLDDVQAPTWLDSVMTSARDFSMGAGKLFGNTGRASVDAAKQIAGNATGSLAALGPMLAGSVAAIPGALGSETMAGVASKLASDASQIMEANKDAFGAGEPQNAGQALGAAVGRSAIGGGPAMIGAFTAADLAAQGLSKFLAPPAEAAPKKFSRNELNAIMNQPPIIGPMPAPYAQPTDTTVINTPAGPTKLPQASLWTMGGMAAATLGMAVGPAVVSAIKKSPWLPKFDPTRDVAGAKTGTIALSTPVDLARAYDDIHAPLFRIAKKAGVDLNALRDVESQFRIQTGSAARNLVHTAVSNGRMETPSFTFKVKEPLQSLIVGQEQVPMFAEYMKARAYMDELMFQQAKAKKNAPTVTIGVGNDTTETAQTVLKSINDMEKINPDLSKAFKLVQENIFEARKFISTGEYALTSKKNASWLNQSAKNMPILNAGSRNTVLKQMQEGKGSLEILEGQMHRLMRQRMENEATGMYIDAMRKNDPRTYMKVSPDWVRKHKDSADSLVSFYRRGKKEYYTTDPLLASIHKSDPYFFMGGMGEAAYVGKRIFESSTTGLFAPFFAATSAIRSSEIGMLTAGGMKMPTPWGAVGAIPQQLAPQLAKSIGESLSNASGGWLASVLGPQNMLAMSDRLMRFYDKSFYAQMASAGGHQGSFLQHHALVQTKLQAAMKQMQPGWSQTFIKGYSDYMNSVHNAASFNFAYRNRNNGMSRPELAARARGLTGDPTIAGQANISAIGGALKYQNNGWIDSVAVPVTRAYGKATDIGRNAVPWWNITTQGMKRIGQAYIDNPIKFTSMMWASQLMPTAALYMYTRSLGNDPHGVPYLDYMMEGRSDFNRMMNFYIPIEGKPASQGIELPNFHELAFARNMFIHALDQAFGRSPLTPAEAFGDTAKSFMKVAVSPPLPSFATAPAAAAGISIPSGMFEGAFGGDAYRKRTDPFDQLGGMNATIELVARAIAPGIADIAGATYAAASSDPNGIVSAIQSGAKAATRRTVEKTAIVRDVIGWKPPVTGNTPTTEALFAKSKAVRNLDSYFKTWIENEGAINIKPQSNAGGALADKFLGPGLPPIGGPAEVYKSGPNRGKPKPPEWSDSPGVYQPEPTNPLFKAFAAQLNNRMQRDDPEEGGFGYKSMWRRYSDYTTVVQRLARVNEGNAGVWQLELLKNKPMLDYLKENKVDYKNPREVRNFFVVKRQQTAKMIMNSIKAVEQEFNNMPEIKQMLGGRPFRIEDMDPYGGLNMPNENAGE